MFGKRVLSWLLCAVMLLGFIPGGIWSSTEVEAAAATVPGSYRLDFKEVAQQLAEEDFWQDFYPGKVDTTKFIGCAKYGTAMEETPDAAYSALRTWLGENTIWNINEEQSGIRNSNAVQTLYFNADGDTPWGLAYRTYFHNMDRSKLVLDVEVPEGGAGLYRLEMDIFRENVNYVSTLPGVYPGGGYLDIYVNDVLVYEDYYFGGPNSRAVENLGMVELKEGTNTIKLHSVAGYTGSESSNERCVYDLCAMEFIPLNGISIPYGLSTSIDLRDSYLPYSAEIDGTYTATSANTSVIGASFDANGLLVLEGKREGETTVTVKKDGQALVELPVRAGQNVPVDQDRLYYTVSGSASLSTRPGVTFTGELTWLTTSLSRLTEEEIRQNGSVYFESSDETVATVDQLTGNVTTAGEGNSVITAHVQYNGVTRTASVPVTVSDNTALASIEILAARDNLATGNAMTLTLSGKKSSGVAADMGKYAVTWSVDQETLAEISQEGRLTGLKPGMVTVTATANGITATKQFEIYSNQEILRKDFLYDLTYGKGIILETGSLEEDGIAYNWDLTTCEPNVGTGHGVTAYPCYPGMVLALDFILPRDGWYTATTFGTSFSYGGAADVFIDGSYMGIMDFALPGGGTYTTPGYLNTIYLEAGCHTLILENCRSGQFFFGKLQLKAAEEPSVMQVALDGEEILLVGQTTEVAPQITLVGEALCNLKQVESKPTDYTNYYILSSSNSKVISVSGNTLTAKGLGTATVTMTGEINGETVTASKTFTVTSGSVAAVELTAAKTTVAPNAAPTQLTLTAYGVSGSKISMPSGASVSYASSNTNVATVSKNGLVTTGATEGSAEITVTVKEGIRTLETSIWITVTSGKTEPTLYTYEERATAKSNVGKFYWAYTQKENAVAYADFFVENLDFYYDAIMHEGLPRAAKIATDSDPLPQQCRYCKVDLAGAYGGYAWIVDPVNNPWKITCPACKRDFPSNDFESYYKSGLDEQGYFHKENADPKYLVNELYPEMGEGWGVDDGFGYHTGNYFANGSEEIHYYIAYYQLCMFYPLSNSSGGMHSVLKGIEMLRDAYLYTGKEKYGNAGMILLDRMADVYPEMNYYRNDRRTRGKITDYIWEGLYVQQVMATAADAFWDCMDNTAVVDYLRANYVRKGYDSPEDITPQSIREHIDNNILLAIKYAIENGQSRGNFGMSQAAMAYAAVALDRLPETKQMLDWLFRDGEFITINTVTGESKWTGGEVMSTLVELVDHDGIGNEGSIMYNRMWYQNLVNVADALKGYTRVEGVDLWKNPKFVDMFVAPAKMQVLGNTGILTGEAGFVQSAGWYPEVDYLVKLFTNTTIDQPAHIEAAKIIYAMNGHNTTALHGDIFTEDPAKSVQNGIQSIINTYGEWIVSDSDMLTGEGIAILRGGPDKFLDGVNNTDFSAYWMLFGQSGGAHGAWEPLHLGIDAYGLNFTSGLGYPIVVATYSPEREQWMRSTLSHNTVMVDEHSAQTYYETNDPLHFEDAGTVKLMDVSAPRAYAQTDIYRRTVVTVQLDEQVSYAVDFFRVLGGKDHVYSFHVNGTKAPTLEGLDPVHQSMGTYAGADVPLGPWYTNPHSTDVAANRGSGASWLDNVYRDTTPDTAFTVDFPVEDFHGRLANSDGLGLRLTMLSEEPLTEVAIADGHPSDNGRNPEYLKYLLAKHEGANGLDSMFTSVIEPYCGSHQISASELVSVTLTDGTETRTDKAMAVKVTRNTGRVDYIVYATNPGCTYEVDGKFTFRGFVGVCSYENGKLVYAYGNEAEQVANVITCEKPRITGQVVDFTKGLENTYTMTIRADQSVTERDLADRYIYVDNDGENCAAYRIYGAKAEGDTMVLDLYTKTLVRGFVDATNPDLGYVYNIQEGQTFTIPTSAVYDPANACKHQNTTSETVSNADKTHTTTVTCQCGEVISTETAQCTDEDKDTLCDVCGAAVITITKFSMAGSNMTLGNELVVNVMFMKNRVTGTGNTIEITHGDAVTTIAQENWESYNAAMYVVRIPVAAKEMADDLTVTVKNADGYEIATAYTTSVREYAMKVLAGSLTTYNQEMKNLAVDMLNYGAAAQTSFSYNTADMANKLLTAEQAGWATEDVVCSNNQVKGTNCAGSNLSLESRILLNVIFRLTETAAADKYAMVTYTDYTGKRVEYRVDSFNRFNASMQGVVIDRVVLADAFQLVTVTVYNADGTVYGTGSDSVESYAARTSNALNAAIMKFATSAKIYLG